MIKKIPRYLKLHVEEEAELPRLPVHEFPGLATLCESFAEVTGWPLHFERRAVEQADVSWMTEIGGNEVPAVGTLFIPRASEATPATQSIDWPLAGQQSETLAASVSQMLSEIQRLRHAVWQREAELATGIPVAMRKDEQQHLADRLEAVMRGGAEAIGCQAAALYLLDDATHTLKMRACWGIPKERLLDEPRPLRGAVGDLEALVGHAVVLEDTELLPHWKVPEAYASAICVPVSSPTNPLGTLWAFGQNKREYSDDETNLLEIVAGRIAADLEREVLLSEGAQSKQFMQQLKYAAHWQANRLPSFAPLVHGWSVAGWNRQAAMMGGDFYDWSILPDGLMSIAVGDAEGELLEAALTASTVQTSLKSHLNYRHNAKQLIDRVNETLWTATAGDQFASLFYGKIDSEKGQVEFSCAGKIHAYHVTKAAIKRINKDNAALGTQPESGYRKKQITLKPGEMLVIASDGARQLLDKEQRPQLESALEYCRLNSDKTADEYVESIGPPFELLDGGDSTIVVVKRHL